MKNYKEFQEDIFNWLYEKHKSDPSFTFSLRMKANKGSETNYFIGTEKAKYFGTTFWNIPVGYPGSASDLIDLFFQLKETGYSYFIYFNQTKNPDNEQNQYALDFIRQVKPLIKTQFENFRETKPEGKMENYTFSPKVIYTSIKPLISHVEQDIERLTKLVDDELTKFKDLYPDFKAHRFTQEEFEELYQKLQKRRTKYITEEENAIETQNPIEKEEKKSPKVPGSNPPLNQILFGPPGTGKTYNTINKSIAIANPGFDLNQSREKVKEEFERLMKEGRIVFTTFHQSMSYEDFIEGIKPLEPEKEGDPVIYKIEYGVFRRLCIEASFAIAQLRETKETEEVLDFSILYDKFSESIEEKLLTGQKVELETKSGGTIMVESISQQGNFIIKHHDGTRTYTVSKARLTKLQSAIKNLDDVSNINDQFREIIGGSNSSAYWSVLNAIKKEKQTKTTKKETRTYTFDDKKEVVLSLSKSDYKNKNGKPFILIIDEINRGNVSQIFGELITLIEDDKRLGNEEALEVCLAYSKEKFGVPPNLYIIGTMNTADRSVEALDAALRRRFSFEEILPKADLIATEGKLKETKGIIKGIVLPLLLIRINKRIEKLLDKDHQIGHSYFMSVSNFEELKLVFKNKIIPLLQEYFFGDYGKIGLVLGEGFFEPMEIVNENLFADFNDYDSSEFDGRTIYKLKDIAKMSDDDFIIAINSLQKK
ncbi:MAG: AAA family ATPase [Bacteroidia bacterium]|nr:AAA family ATPase [Bacteroidia bacterium]